MKRANCRIEIGDYIFDYTHSVTINSTWKNLTDKITIQLPRRYKSVMVGGVKTTLDKVIKVGDEVSIELGYDFRLHPIFKGYVSKLKPSYPIEISAEDEMYNYKKTKVKPKAFRGGRVAEILEYIGINEFKMFGDSLTIGDFMITEEMSTVARVLEKIKDESGFPVFFRNNILYIGGQYNSESKVHFFQIGRNIIEHDLEYRRKEDYPVCVEVISKLQNGEEIKVKVGDESSNSYTHTKHIYGITDKSKMESIGYAEIDKVSFTGWVGGFKAFGEPVMNQGDIVELSDIGDGLIKGRYYIDEVETVSSVNDGYKQNIKLGQILK